MLYIKLIIFITQHQDIACSAGLYKGQHILNLSGTAHSSHVQMDKTGSCHYFTLLFPWLQTNVLWTSPIPICENQHPVLPQTCHTITQKS